jgi:hypothetical protein
MKKGPTKIEAGTVTISVRQEQWDANIHSHADQGVIIDVEGHVDGADTALLRFTCFDIERSYTYAPDGKGKVCRMDPIVDGNPIGWSIKQLRSHLPEMLSAAGFEAIAGSVDTQLVAQKLDEVDAVAREKFLNGRRLVKHNRGTDMFEAGIIRFGLEMRTLGADGGLAIHVLTDLAGTPTASYAEETEVLAFDCFREAPHYHYGPRNKNHRIYFDKTLIKDPLEWTLEVFKSRKLSQMIAAAGYPGVAADVDEDLIASLIPSIEAKAREMQPKATD